MTENYNGDFEIGRDCLDPEMKKMRIAHKAFIIEQGRAPTDEEILNEAEEKAQDSHYKGPVDPGPLCE